MTATDEPVKSAWTKGLKDAPQDRPILIRTPTWDCPAVMEFAREGNESGWAFVEGLLLDVCGWMTDEDMVEAEWAEIPT